MPDAYSLVDKVGVTTDLPPGALKLIEQTKDTVTFQVNREKLKVLSVGYLGENGNTCAKNEDVGTATTEPPLVYTASCYGDSTRVSIFALVGDGADFEATECGECKAPQGEDSGVAAYYLEVSCKPVLCSEIPDTPAPTVPTTPAPVPTTPAPVPTTPECAYEYTEIDFSAFPVGTPIISGQFAAFGMNLESTGDNVITVYDYGGDIGKAIILMDTINLNNQGPNPSGGEVILTLDTSFKGKFLVDVFGLDPGQEPSATVETEAFKSGGATESLEINASTLVQEVEVTAFGTSRITVNLKGTGAISKIGFCRDPSITVTPAPAEITKTFPTAAPVNISPCPDDVKLLSVNGERGATYAAFLAGQKLPINIRSRDKETVTFEVINTWTKTIEYIYIQVYKPNQDVPCIEKKAVQVGEPEYLTAICMKHSPVTVVDVWLSDPSLEDTDLEIPQCCHGPPNDTNPKWHFVFEVACECPEDYENQA
jgi:hypothetical protein